MRLHPRRRGFFSQRTAFLCATHTARSRMRDAGLRFLHFAMRLVFCAKCLMVSRARRHRGPVGC